MTIWKKRAVSLQDATREKITILGPLLGDLKLTLENQSAFLTSFVAFVSSGERPSLISSSTLFGGGFSGAVRATELSVTANMAASKILQTSISSQKNDK